MSFSPDSLAATVGRHEVCVNVESRSKYCCQLCTPYISLGAIPGPQKAKGKISREIRFSRVPPTL